MQSFVWHATDSFLERLNPLTKLALAMLVAAAVSSCVEPFAPAAIALLCLIAGKTLGKLPWVVLTRPIGLAALLSFGMFWTSALFYTGKGLETAAIVFEAGPLRLTDVGLVYGLAMSARLLAIFSASILFVVTTDPAEFVLALIQQGRLPYRIGYAVFAAYRFVPMVGEELANIRAAHQVRGVGEGHGVIQTIRRTVGYLIPLLAISVRRAERVALAMDSRAFGSIEQRTYFRPTVFGLHDMAFSAGSLVVLVAIVLLRLVPGLGYFG